MVTENTMSFFWIYPFIINLLGLALLPLFFPHFWEKNTNKGWFAFSVALAPFIFLVCYHPEHLLHTLHDYFSFITLLIGLFITSGGIFLDGNLEAQPKTNTLFLAAGSVLASLIGTTGASLLLIRPLLHTNRERHHTRHIPLFFIFIVANAGGLLTPIGDPPLFLGYLRGVPFFWTLKLFPIWVSTVLPLLAIFYIWDTQAYKKEIKKDLLKDKRNQIPLTWKGKFNFLFLAGVVGSVFLPSPFREITMLTMAFLSWKITPRDIHKKNHFNFHPINEVILVFGGLFITMAPALLLIHQHSGTWGPSHPASFFWLTGILSSFLDNAPTYLTFFSLAQKISDSSIMVAGVKESWLIAISAGAVLMGANSYIGNGPNFMIKAIAEKSGISMPSFFSYMAYAAMILGPLFGLITWIFFRV